MLVISFSFFLTIYAFIKSACSYKSVLLTVIPPSTTILFIGILLSLIIAYTTSVVLRQGASNNARIK